MSAYSLKLAIRAVGGSMNGVVPLESQLIKVISKLMNYTFEMFWMIHKAICKSKWGKVIKESYTACHKYL